MALGLVMTGCDSGGSDSKSWEGNWEVTEVDGEDPGFDPGDELYYNLSTDAFTYVFVDGPTGNCFISQDPVVEVDGNVVTARNSTGDFNGDLFTTEYTVQNGTLEGEFIRTDATPNSTDDPGEMDDTGDVFEAQPLDGPARDQAEDCKKDKSGKNIPFL